MQVLPRCQLVPGVSFNCEPEAPSLKWGGRGHLTGTVTRVWWWSFCRVSPLGCSVGIQVDCWLSGLLAYVVESKTLNQTPRISLSWLSCLGAGDFAQYT